MCSDYPVGTNSPEAESKQVYILLTLYAESRLGGGSVPQIKAHRCSQSWSSLFLLIQSFGVCCNREREHGKLKVILLEDSCHFAFISMVKNGHSHASLQEDRDYAFLPCEETARRWHCGTRTCPCCSLISVCQPPEQGECWPEHPSRAPQENMDCSNVIIPSNI